MNVTALVLNWLGSHIVPFFFTVCLHIQYLCISILCVHMSLTDGVALAGAAKIRSNSWQGSPAGLCLVLIGWAWPGVGLKRGRERTDQPCRQKDRMGEREEESGRTWPAALTLMEDGERRGESAVMWATYVTAIKKRELKRQISIYITVLHEQKCNLKFLCSGTPWEARWEARWKLEGALMSRCFFLSKRTSWGGFGIWSGSLLDTSYKRFTWHVPLEADPKPGMDWEWKMALDFLTQAGPPTPSSSRNTKPTIKIFV